MVNRPLEILDFGATEDVNTTDSPEIGPPPVSQFVDEDPVKIDLPQKSHMSSKTEEENSMEPALSVNLEQRRRRKDGGSSSENRRSSTVGLSIQEADATSTLKTGAKRKLSVREDEEDDKNTSVATSSPTKAQHDSGPIGKLEERRRVKLSSSSASESIASSAKTKVNAQEQQDVVPRKVLAAKSVNKSPKKQVRASMKEEGKPEKPNNVQSNSDVEKKERRQQQPVKITPVEALPRPTETIIVSKEEEVNIEPETPAPSLDIFSPPTSQPSTARNESRDTPPPTDFGASNEAARPSRRARGAVSYAEPNLRDKMRRPGKELVDAVGADSKSSRTSLGKLDDNAPLTSWKVKPEATSEVGWKDMPEATANTVENSPLRSKSTAMLEALPDTISTHRKRRESLLQQSDVQSQPSGAGNTIIAMLTENRKAKAAAATERSRDPSMTMRQGSDVSLSSKQQSTAVVRDTKEKKPLASSRRYSTLPRETSSPEDRELSDVEKAKTSDTSTSRRRQSSLGIKTSSSKLEISSRENAADRVMKRPASTVDLPTTGALDSRSDRISARRRSMML